MHILLSNLDMLDLKRGCQLCCTSLGMPYSVVTADQGCRTKMVNIKIFYEMTYICCGITIWMFLVLMHSGCVFGHVYFQRQEIVTGNIEPTDSDCDWPSDDEEGEDEKLAVSVTCVYCCGGILLSTHWLFSIDLWKMADQMMHFLSNMDLFIYQFDITFIIISDILQWLIIKL